jgi:sulfate transport system permease protein
MSDREKIIPGFSLTLGFTIFYLSLLVFIPLSMVFLNLFKLDYATFERHIFSARTLAAFKITFLTSFYAALVNSFFGFIVAWVLVRYRFPGRKIFDALVDLPFALPTAVAGIALTAAYSQNGLIGKYLYDYFGIQVAYTSLGIFIALMFIGLPFVVRSLQPVIEDIDTEIEEAAATLGASRLNTFVSVLLPGLFPAMLTGFCLAFARALGEYGSVVFISGNMPMKTEIVPLLIMTKLEQFDYAGATALAFVMLMVSFIMLLSVNLLQGYLRRRNRQ